VTEIKGIYCGKAQCQKQDVRLLETKRSIKKEI